MTRIPTTKEMGDALVNLLNMGCELHMSYDDGATVLVRRDLDAEVFKAVFFEQAIVMACDSWRTKK
jgi:hypothetical protein